LGWFGKFLRFLVFEEEFQRRGVHVNVPEIGSRDGETCFGGIFRFYAEL
jgi:hypothetical protein